MTVREDSPTSGVVLRPARREDAEGLTRVHLEVWEQAYRGLLPDQVFDRRREQRADWVRRWEQIAESSETSTTVAESGERILGFACVGPVRDAGIEVPVEVWSIYLDRSAWGTGVGAALLATAVGHGPAYLWVLDGNDRAIAFYRKHGFELDGAERTDDLGRELRMIRRAG